MDTLKKKPLKIDGSKGEWAFIYRSPTDPDVITEVIVAGRPRPKRKKK